MSLHGLLCSQVTTNSCDRDGLDKRATHLALGICRSMNAIGRPAELAEPPFAWLRCVSFRTLTNCTALPELWDNLLQHS